MWRFGRTAVISGLFAAALMTRVCPGAEVSLPDLEGISRLPLKPGTNKASVLFFVLQDCPVANAYAPEIGRIVKEYSPKGIAFHVVHVDFEITVAEARKHATDYGHRCPVLIDREHVLVKHAGATITPEAAVLGPRGEILYRGRIDDRQAAPGKRRPQATTRELRDALDAVLEGRPVKNKITQAVGCYIPTPARKKSP